MNLYIFNPSINALEVLQGRRKGEKGESSFPAWRELTASPMQIEVCLYLKVVVTEFLSRLSLVLSP